jgi:hypothetical protein
VFLGTKQQWLDAAEVFDAWRIVPRTLVYGFGAWTIYIADRTLFWYFHLATVDRTVQDAGLVGATISAVTTVFGLTLKFYYNSGRQWTGQPARNQGDNDK